MSQLNGLKIVWEGPGERTGERLCRTEDGTVWTNEHIPHATGVRYGTRIDGTIAPDNTQVIVTRSPGPIYR